jgi:hypothetical protein
MPVLNMQGIFQYQFLLAPKGGVDQIRHLQPPLPSQSGHLVVSHQLQLLLRPVRFLPSLNTHSLGQIIRWQVKESADCNYALPLFCKEKKSHLITCLG